jgi:hypothetical protein
MKSTIVIASLVIIAASCNTKPKTESIKKEPVDTAGFAAYQAQESSRINLLQPQKSQRVIPQQAKAVDKPLQIIILPVLEQVPRPPKELLTQLPGAPKRKAGVKQQKEP